MPFSRRQGVVRIWFILDAIPVASLTPIPPLSDNVELVRQTGAHTVLPAFGDARHCDAWQSAFGRARVVLQGPVAL